MNIDKKVNQYRQLLGLDNQEDTYQSLLKFLVEDLPLPASLLEWLGKLALLYGVPFNNLVAEETMLTNSQQWVKGKKDAPTNLLEKNCLRFFYLDMSWIDSMIDGALSLATQNTADYQLQKALHIAFRAQIEQQMLNYRRHLKDLPPNDPLLVPTQMGTISGLLFRSPIVEQWPGLEVKAFFQNGHPDNNNPADMLQVLRMERLAPDVLLLLFSSQFKDQPPTKNSGIPEMIVLKEPSESVYNGFDSTGGTKANDAYTMELRKLSGKNIGAAYGGKANPKLYQLQQTDFRDFENRVLNIAALKKNICAAYKTIPSPRPKVPERLSPKDMAALFINSPRHYVFNPKGA